MTNRTQPETPVGGPLGDTGDGNTGVPEFEQGISNRPGDRRQDGLKADDEGNDDSGDSVENGDDELEITGEDEAGRRS
jgi:hypothetical protein